MQLEIKTGKTLIMFTACVCLAVITVLCIVEQSVQIGLIAVAGITSLTAIHQNKSESPP